jgi:hypothetical protein
MRSEAGLKSMTFSWKAAIDEGQELSHILEFLKMTYPVEESEDLWMVTVLYVVDRI